MGTGSLEGNTMTRPSTVPGRPREDARSDDESPDLSVAPETVLDLLDDEYARAILASISATAKPARELVGELDTSRPTVYRRLNRLEEAGLVESRMSIEPDGHHRQVYRATLSDVTLSLSDDGLRIAGLTVAD